VSAPGASSQQQQQQGLLLASTTTALLSPQHAHAALDALLPRLAAPDWRARLDASQELAGALLPALPAGAALGRALGVLAPRLSDANTRVSVATLQVSRFCLSLDPP
jgi:hypothetical protein